MKRYKYILLSVAVALGVSGCSLDTKVYDYKDADESITALTDVKSTLIGIYNEVGYYKFLGNYAVSIADMTSGVSAGSAASGHMYSFSTFTFSDTNEELEQVWEYGYKAISASAKAITTTEGLIASGAIVEDDQPVAYNYIAQYYALKALAEYYLVNYFALPYSEANKSKLGIIVLDKDVPQPFDKVSRGTLEETYSQIKADIAAAEDAYDKAGKATETSAFYMNPAAVQGLKARVYMALGDYDTAEEAALTAIEMKDTGDGDASDDTPSDATYLSMWADFRSETSEDIFTIVKSSDDNLSANSLNTLYSTYYCTIQNKVGALFGDNDIRTGLLITEDEEGDDYLPKFYGGSDNVEVANIPVIRKSEMSLIVAECEARSGNIATAQSYLFYTAKRDKDITSASELPDNTADLLAFIADERVREFFGEGHRFFDARRMGLKISGDQFSDWDIQKFCFPIPASEINSGSGCQQNTGWEDNLPL